VWVVDATDPRQCEEFTTVLQHLPDASLLVLANKQDCDGARSVEDVTTELGLSCEKERHWHVQACSAKTGAGLDEGIRWLMEDIGSRLCQHWITRYWKATSRGYHAILSYVCESELVSGRRLASKWSRMCVFGMMRATQQDCIRFITASMSMYPKRRRLKTILAWTNIYFHF